MDGDGGEVALAEELVQRNRALDALHEDYDLSPGLSADVPEHGTPDAILRSIFVSLNTLVQYHRRICYMMVHVMIYIAHRCFCHKSLLPRPFAGSDAEVETGRNV